MIRGSTLLTKLQERRRSIESEKRTLSRSVVDHDAQLEVLRRNEAVAWARFASAQLTEGDSLPPAVQDLIDERNRAYAKAGETLELAESEIAALEKQRDSLQTVLSEAQGRLREKQAEVLVAIDTDQRVVDLRQEASVIGDNLASMRHKQERAERDAQEKGIAYEEDEFFVYLRNRGYGTEGYAPKGIFRTLDRWLADLTGYREAAANLDRLNSIPDWLRDRIGDLETKLRSIKGALEEIQDEHDVSLKPFESAVRQAESDFDHAEATIRAARLDGKNAARFLDEVAKGKDPIQQKIMATLISGLSNEKRDALRRLAASTRSAEDDLALSEIEETQRQRQHLSADADRMRSELSVLDRRLAAVEDAEKRLKRKGWDRNSAEFDMTSRNQDDLIDRLAAGYIASDIFFREVSKTYEEPKPKYELDSLSSGNRSSGGFGGGSSNWGSSSSKREDSGSSWSSGGSFGGSSDSWSTGGSFGGGGDDSSSGGGF